jgi:hypothetical protein
MNTKLAAPLALASAVAAAFLFQTETSSRTAPSRDPGVLDSINSNPREGQTQDLLDLLRSL